MFNNIQAFQIPERANSVSRFSGSHLLNHRSSISEHSYEVTFYAMILTDRWSKSVSFLSNIKSDIMESAMLHDVPEIFTGDVPYPVKKKYPNLKKMLSKIETQFMSDVLPEYLNKKYHPWVRFIVKYCDSLAVAKEIVNEVEFGNKQFEPFVPNIQAIFKKLYSDPEVTRVEDWEYLHSLSVGFLEEVGLDKYVKTAEL